MQINKLLLKIFKLLHRLKLRILKRPSLRQIRNALFRRIITFWCLKLPIIFFQETPDLAAWNCPWSLACFTLS